MAVNLRACTKGVFSLLLTGFLFPESAFAALDWREPSTNIIFSCEDSDTELLFEYSLNGESIDTVTWSIGSTIIASYDGTFSPRSEYTGNLTHNTSKPTGLTINDVSAGDSGTYTCTVVSNLGNFYSTSEYLNVSERATKCKPVIQRIGQTLRCTLPSDGDCGEPWSTTKWMFVGLEEGVDLVITTEDDFTDNMCCLHGAAVDICFPDNAIRNFCETPDQNQNDKSASKCGWQCFVLYVLFALVVILVVYCILLGKSWSYYFGSVKVPIQLLLLCWFWTLRPINPTEEDVENNDGERVNFKGEKPYPAIQQGKDKPKAPKILLIVTNERISKSTQKNAGSKNRRPQEQNLYPVLGHGNIGKLHAEQGAQRNDAQTDSSNENNPKSNKKMNAKEKANNQGTKETPQEKAKQVVHGGLNHEFTKSSRNEKKPNSTETTSPNQKAEHSSTQETESDKSDNN